jgi:hypothetical protein
MKNGLVIFLVCVIALVAGYWMFYVGIILLKAFIGLALLSIFGLGFLTARFIYKRKNKQIE